MHLKLLCIKNPNLSSSIFFLQHEIETNNDASYVIRFSFASYTDPKKLLPIGNQRRSDHIATFLSNYQFNQSILNNEIKLVDIYTQES